MSYRYRALSLLIIFMFNFNVTFHHLIHSTCFSELSEMSFGSVGFLVFGFYLSVSMQL